jgi:Family of unknown function (DUF6527)
MISHKHLKHHFVEHIPEQLQPGLLYISMPYAIAAHSCCCGCGEEVVTPFTPRDWKMIFDGETVSLKPSIGNWNIPCRSHYVIDRGRVIEAEPWTDEQVEAEQSCDRAAKAKYYGQSPVSPPLADTPIATIQTSEATGPWLRAWHWINGNR